MLNKISINPFDCPLKSMHLQVLYAITGSSTEIVNKHQASALLTIFEKFIINLPQVSFSRHSAVVELSPWTKLAFEVTVCLSNLGLNVPSLKDQVYILFNEFLEKTDFTNLKGQLCLIGFIRGISKRRGILNPSLIKKVLSFDSINFWQIIEDVTFSNEVTILEDYITTGEEFNSLLFIVCFNQLQFQYIKKITDAPEDLTLVDHMLKSTNSVIIQPEDQELISHFINLQKESVQYLDNASDRIRESTSDRIFAGYCIQADSLEIYSFGIATSIIDFGFVSEKISSGFDRYVESLSHYFSNGINILNSNLLMNMFAASAILSESDQKFGMKVISNFPKVLSRVVMPKSYVKRLASTVVYSLKSLNADDESSIIYTLTNLLQEKHSNQVDSVSIGNSSFINDTDAFAPNIVTAVLELARYSKDSKFYDLVFTLLAPRLSPNNIELNAIILEGIAESLDSISQKDVLKFVHSIYEAKSPLYNIEVWKKFSRCVYEKCDSDLYEAFLTGLLSIIVADGKSTFDMTSSTFGQKDKKGNEKSSDLEEHKPNTVVVEVAKKIGFVLGPLSELLPPVDESPMIPTSKELIKLFKDMWFNLAIHGFAYDSPLYRKHEAELVRIAHSSPPLASESSWNRSETSIELETVLRKGTSKTTERLHKETLKDLVRINTQQLSRPAIMFLSATVSLEFSRLKCGDCSTILEYLTDPSIQFANLINQLGQIAQESSIRYINIMLKGTNPVFSGDRLAVQLKKVFVACCHRVESLQHCAFLCADKILGSVPTGLCYETSTFALLDIISLLFQSIIDADTNEYEPITEFKSKVSDVDLSLSDAYDWRQKTLDLFTSHSSSWVTNALTVSEYDMKVILRSYVNQSDSYHRTVNYGVSFALDMASKILPCDREFYQLAGAKSKRINTTAGFLTQTPELNTSNISSYYGDVNFILKKVNEKIKQLETEDLNFKPTEENHKIFRDTMEHLSKVIINFKIDDLYYLESLVKLPFLSFTSYSIEHSLNIWINVMKSRPEHHLTILNLILSEFKKSVHDGKGLYDRLNDLKDPKFDPMEYLPSNKKIVDKKSKIVSSNFKPHLLLIRFIGSHFNATLFQSSDIWKIFADTIKFALLTLNSASLHPYSRMVRSELILLGIDIYKYYSKLNHSDNYSFFKIILDASLSWFTRPVATPFGNNKLKVKADMELLKLMYNKFSSFNLVPTSLNSIKRAVLFWFINDEISIIETWLDPLGTTSPRANTIKLEDQLLTYTYNNINGKLAVNMIDRCTHNGTISNSLKSHLKKLILADPYEVSDFPMAVSYIIDSPCVAIVFWTPSAPVDNIKMFLPPFNKNNLVVQYAMRSIETFDIHLTFFYVPQIVQTMRHDSMGYIRRFIIETANVSQLFAHQIIWNMAANSFKDEDSQIPDDIKPALDDIKHSMIKSFSGEDKLYFEKEFKFFEEVTGISGKLKPYIKKPKPDKKAKIDEEMALIKVEEGVYLPSNPDGFVVDIDRKSGKPLQSHAKAPFMATFMIKKQKEESDEFEIVKTSAIFKVGDDCRQDVLALQLISVFRTIWMNYGVDVYVFPYRVTATAPGCGIIDVLPNSISRDMLGREQVNGLYEYFISQFGPETGAEFQRARNNFVKSLAAYSIITYLLAIKDRHNGNIMYDNDGHILHIDFGFCFDIVPGGVKFEQSAFKLTREMVRVMGGSTTTQAYKWYEELCVKCFLACRIHMDTIVNMVYPMLESGLPCFKPDSIKHLQQRFVPQKSERDAALYMRKLIRKSFESMATKGYDEFQRLTNGIPY